MNLLLVLTLVGPALVSSNPSITNKDFINLVTHLDSSYDDDMDDILSSEDIYIEAVKASLPVYESAVELLIGPEEELADDPDEDIEEDVSGDEDDSDLPEELDFRDTDYVHRAIYQGACGSCGWVSGTQTLEARMAFVSENYRAYSIQNFMNCNKRICVGAQPYSVNHHVRGTNYIAPEEEIAYTKKACLKWGPNKSGCLCGAGNANFTNVLDEQFVIVGPTRAARTELELRRALQTGPVTTCFQTGGKGNGERCRAGCNHANSIVGYSKDNFIVQDSYGKNWGKYNDGSWRTTRGSECADAIIKKAYYPVIFYDYDRANAYFTAVDVGVNETDLESVDKDTYGITDADTRNVGTAKNKCAFIGSACKGVVKLSSGAFELVADFGAGSSGKTAAFKKTQMVVYLRHEGTGKYMGIAEELGNPILKSVDGDEAAPFFTSIGRFISFDYPTYHMVDNKLEKIIGGVRDIDVIKTWRLGDCNLHNAASGMSLDIGESDKSDKKGQMTFTGNPFNKTSTSQRFDIGLSGKWALKSKELNDEPLRRNKGSKELSFSFPDTKKNTISPFRWNARQIMLGGKSLDGDMKLSNTDFKFGEADKVITPTDCAVMSMAGDDHLNIEGGEVVMTSDVEGRWTFVYGDL